MNKNIIILPLVGGLLWNVHREGPLPQPHTVETNYSTQTLSSVTTPVSGSLSAVSSSCFFTDQWMG